MDSILTPGRKEWNPMLFPTMIICTRQLCGAQLAIFSTEWWWDSVNSVANGQLCLQDYKCIRLYLKGIVCSMAFQSGLVLVEACGPYLWLLCLCICLEEKKNEIIWYSHRHWKYEEWNTMESSCVADSIYIMKFGEQYLASNRGEESIDDLIF
jgi:hypothetical protein